MSEDGENYTEVAALDYGVEAKDDPDTVEDITFSFPQTSARYVRVSLIPVESLPEWHYKPGSRAFVFVDELMVR